MHIPKRHLVSRLAILLETGKLRIAEGLRLKDELIRELSDFQGKLSRATGHDSYEGARGAHDDLALSWPWRFTSRTSYCDPREIGKLGLPRHEIRLGRVYGSHWLIDFSLRLLHRFGR